MMDAMEVIDDDEIASDINSELLYLDDNVENGVDEEPVISHATDLAILHSSGIKQKTPEEFITETMRPDFTSGDALSLLQRRYTMDYGRKRSGSRRASTRQDYYPVFHLDMISIVGCPMRPITEAGAFFDNVTFTLQHWQAPYSSKHAASSLPFDLTNRTFRLATAASREIWFVVMHPKRAAAQELPASQPRHQQAEKAGAEKAGAHSGMQLHHAEILASYIKDIFLDGSLLGEGVEPSWALGGQRSQNMSLDKWSRFQALFMERWGQVPARYGHDKFWTEHEPAFHAYDHGANIEIEVTETLESVPREARLRKDDEDRASESDSESGTDDEDDNTENGDESASRGLRGAALPGGGRDGGRISSNHASAAHGDTADARGERDEGICTPLFHGGLEHLRRALEQKYVIDNIAQVSYAVAADINCTDGSNDQQVVCLLADRSRVLQTYESPGAFTFYPLGFHPRYGNFTSNRPPLFLRDLYAIMQDNMSLVNEERDVLCFGFFQAYSNIKRSIRHGPDDLLATKGIATGALTLPPSAADREPARVRAKQERLLRQHRGELTPDDPAASMPFARERRRVEAMEEEQLAFRMEQVVTVRASQLADTRRTFQEVLRPIFQIMLFFLRERKKYTAMLRTFKPAIFPGVLCSFARVFELALREMDVRFRSADRDGLNVALSEGTALLDRLGNYCFTGDRRVLPSAVLKPLQTTESLRKGAWPFICPEMLDLRPEDGMFNVAKWPRSEETAMGRRPLLLHVAALGYHYNALVATNRLAEVWFGQLSLNHIKEIRSATMFLEEMFRELWIPQTAAFLGLQLRRRLACGSRSGVTTAERRKQLEEIGSLLATWEQSAQPFSKEVYDSTFSRFAGDNYAAILGPTQVSTQARHDYAEQVLKACRSRGKNVEAGAHAKLERALTSSQGTWLRIVRSAIQHTRKEDIRRDDWSEAIRAAMCTARIDWVPGVQSSRITSKHIVHLVGSATGALRIGRPTGTGNLRKRAAEAERRLLEEDRQTKRARRRVIDFECAFPFKTIPPKLLKGFNDIYSEPQQKSMAISNHYQLAQNCLLRHLDNNDFRVQLMLMQVLTLAASSVTPEVPSGSAELQAFQPAKKPRDRGRYAASLATRMLWFLDRNAFPWTKEAEADARGACSVTEMVKKMEHRHTNNRVLRLLGWVSVKGTRPTPHNRDCELQSTEVLRAQYERLLGMLKDPTSFIKTVFHTDDEVWVDRCEKIMVDRKGRRGGPGQEL